MGNKNTAIYSNSVLRRTGMKKNVVLRECEGDANTTGMRAI